MSRAPSSPSRSLSEFERTSSSSDRRSIPTTIPTSNSISPLELPLEGSRQPRDEFDDTSVLADPRVEAPRILKEYDVAALIVNKMIGTGIFTGPYTVLACTGSKKLTIGLWILGFLYTILSMIMYLEYARKLPFTGGELVYLDDLMPKHRLWAYTLYSFYFVFVYTTCTNAMQFGVQVLLASSGNSSTTEDNVDLRLVRFLAVVITTAICILLYLSDQKSRLANRTTAGAKIIFLLIVSFLGAAYLNRHGANMEDWAQQDLGENQQKELGCSGPSNWVSAFITVLFSFHGWENATLVAGEIPSFYVLRKGFIGAVSVVGTLYLLVVCIFCLAFDWKKAESEPLKIFTAAYFSSGESGNISDAAAVSTAVIIAISAVGSMISVAYTGVRVRQSIGWAGILPWSWYWRRSGPLRPKFDWRQVNDHEQRVALVLEQDALTHPGSPEGGILSHWIATVFYVCITATQDKLKDAIDFSGNLLVYGHFVFEGLVAVGFIWFDPCHASFLQFGFPAPHWLDIDDRSPPSWMRQLHDNGLGPLQWIIKGRGQTVLGLMVLAFSVAVVVMDLYYQGQGRTCVIIMAGILVLAWIYWALFVRVSSASRIYDWFGYELHSRTHGENDENDPSRRCHWCGGLPERSGHRHPHDSYKSFNEVILRKVAGEEFPLRTRIIHAIFGERSLDDLSIHPWFELKKVLSRHRSRERVNESISLQNTR